MNHSLSKNINENCLHCNSTVKTKSWLIVDTKERPDLYKEIIDEKFNLFRCSECGYTAGARHPILIYCPKLHSPLVFSTFSRPDIESQEQLLWELAGKLQLRMGNLFQKRWLKDGVKSVLRKDLPTHLSGSTSLKPGFSLYMSSIIKKLDQPTGMAEAIQIVKLLLTMTSPEDNPELWGNLQVKLGYCFLSISQGDRSENIDKAIKAFKQALTVRPPDNTDPAWAIIMMHLAEAYFYRSRNAKTDNFEETINAYKQAITLKSQIPKPEFWASTASTMAFTLLRKNKGNNEIFELGISAFKEALKIYTLSAFPRWRSSESRLLLFYLFEANRWEESLKISQLALEAADTQYIRALPQQVNNEYEKYQRRSFMFHTSSYLRFHFDTVSIFHFASYALFKTGRLLEALLSIEQGQTKSPGGLMTNDVANLSIINEKDPATFEIYENAAENFDEMNRRLCKHISALEQPDRVYINLRNRAEQALEDLNNAFKAIQKVPGFEDFLSKPDKNEIVQALNLISQKNKNPNTALVYFITTPKGSLALIVTADQSEDALKIEPVHIDFSHLKMEELLEYYSKIPRDCSPGQLGVEHEKVLKEYLPEILTTLGEKIVAPVADALRAQNITHITLIPAGLISSLPLHAAQYTQGSKTVCLLDEFDISYAVSARLILRSNMDSLENAEKTQVITGIGNPRPADPELKFAEAELKEVSALFDEKNRRLLYGEDATKEALKELIPGTTYLHLACYGFFKPKNSTESHLSLSNKEFLRFWDIQKRWKDLFSKTRLVVLSACNTAITTAMLTGESVGLPTGFLLAGVPGVLGTLWSVNDLSTTLFMIKFYEFHLKGDKKIEEPPMPPARAVCCAQRWLKNVTVRELMEWFKKHISVHNKHEEDQQGDISEELASVGVMQFVFDEIKNPDSKPFADKPYHWAPFIFVGV